MTPTIEVHGKHKFRGVTKFGSLESIWMYSMCILEMMFDTKVEKCIFIGYALEKKGIGAITLSYRR